MSSLPNRGRLGRALKVLHAQGGDPAELWQVQPFHTWILPEGPPSQSLPTSAGVQPCFLPKLRRGRWAVFSNPFTYLGPHHHLHSQTLQPRKAAYLEEYEDEEQLVDHTHAEPEPPVSYKDTEHRRQAEPPRESAARTVALTSELGPVRCASFPPGFPAWSHRGRRARPCPLTSTLLTFVVKRFCRNLQIPLIRLRKPTKPSTLFFP